MKLHGRTNCFVAPGLFVVIGGGGATAGAVGKINRLDLCLDGAIGHRAQSLGNIPLISNRESPPEAILLSKINLSLKGRPRPFMERATRRN